MMNMYQVRVTQSTELYDLREKNKKTTPPPTFTDLDPLLC